MFPIVTVAFALVLLHWLSGSRSVNLPALTEKRRREILDGRYEEAARTSRIQLVARSKVRYGTLTDEEQARYSETKTRIDQLREAA